MRDACPLLRPAAKVRHSAAGRSPERVSAGPARGDDDRPAGHRLCRGKVPAATSLSCWFGKLGGIRQWIESIYNTAKDRHNLEQHGGRIREGVWVRVCQRVLALAAGVWHSGLVWEAGTIDTPGRHFIT